MPHSAASIEALQDEFARSLLWRVDGVPAAVAGPQGPAPGKRFNVYRNNVFASLIDCLRARFPVVARPVGDEFFAAMARLFIERHPSAPALLEYGEELPVFLRTFEPVGGLPYLPDVAQLEWLMAAAYHAPDARAISADALVVLGENVLDATVELHPSCAILTSDYPVFSLWCANTYDEVVRPIDASAGGEAVLIVRPEFEVVLIKIDTSTHAFIAALAAGHALELAVEIASEIDARFDVAAALRLLFSAGAVTGVRPEEYHFDRTQSPPMRMNQCEI